MRKLLFVIPAMIVMAFGAMLMLDFFERKYSSEQASLYTMTDYLDQGRAYVDDLKAKLPLDLLPGFGAETAPVEVSVPAEPAAPVEPAVPEAPVEAAAAAPAAPTNEAPVPPVAAATPEQMLEGVDPANGMMDFITALFASNKAEAEEPEKPVRAKCVTRQGYKRCTFPKEED